ncbi:HlyD family secretion protein [Acinetobacter rongchengensis]|uniref:Biotin/lipoyl-binding protein n=1 Tax=Acinetobacter rongchengensis TaxID=2419601 RepID=A0A3A8EUK2_9GAMM|nr:efflux RND transporter periplasmic adaptor subunit [Acinetobacter rongchengensis]RKG37829.1 biotin/lipoyl-binding protein [Acinetobacter rongchengensis]
MTQEKPYPSDHNQSSDDTSDSKLNLESNSSTSSNEKLSAKTVTNQSTSSDESPKKSSSDKTDEQQHPEHIVHTVNDAQSNPENKTAPATPTPKNKALLAIGVIILVALLGLIAFGLWKSYQPKTIDVQGRVETETLHVSTKVPSRIEGIFVHDGQKVEKGQLLVTLSSPEIATSKQQALAGLQSALALQSSVDRGAQQENIDSLYANWQSLKAQENLAKTTFNRGQNLYQQGVISRQRRDEMQAAAISATQLTEAAYQQYARAKRGSTSQQKTSADAQVEIAKAAVAEANALEAETKLFSPISGTVSKTYGKPSELVAIGVPVVSILQDDEQWVSLNVREDQYTQVYQAQSLDGFIPALNKTVKFNIESIDAEGEFATIKTTRQTGGYDIRSFKIKLTPAAPLTDLKVGMSVIFKLKENP